MDINITQLKKKIARLSDDDPSKLRLNADVYWVWLVVGGVTGVILISSFSYLFFFKYFDEDFFAETSSVATSSSSVNTYVELQERLDKTIETYEHKQKDFNDLLFSPPSELNMPERERVEGSSVEEDNTEITPTDTADAPMPLGAQLKKTGSQMGAIGQVIIDWLR